MAARKPSRSRPLSPRRPIKAAPLVERQPNGRRRPPPIPFAVQAPQPPFAVIEISGGNVQAEHLFGCQVHVIDWDNAKDGDRIVGHDAMLPPEALRRLPRELRKEIAARDADSEAFNRSMGK